MYKLWYRVWFACSTTMYCVHSESGESCSSIEVMLLLLFEMNLRYLHVTIFVSRYVMLNLIMLCVCVQLNYNIQVPIQKVHPFHWVSSRMANVLHVNTLFKWLQCPIPNPVTVASLWSSTHTTTATEWQPQHNTQSTSFTFTHSLTTSISAWQILY